MPIKHQSHQKRKTRPAQKNLLKRTMTIKVLHVQSTKVGQLKVSENIINCLTQSEQNVKVHWEMNLKMHYWLIVRITKLVVAKNQDRKPLNMKHVDMSYGALLSHPK